MHYYSPSVVVVLVTMFCSAISSSELIGYATFYVLAPTRLWSPDGSHKWVVYSDPSLTYLGPSHAIQV